MTTTKTKSKKKSPSSLNHGQAADVLTLSEAASYLRTSEEEVVRMIAEQDLPARQVGSDWRLLKSAVERWLSQPASRARGVWAAAGSWKDDPFFDDMLGEIYRNRGRPITEKD